VEKGIEEVHGFRERREVEKRQSGLERGEETGQDRTETLQAGVGGESFDCA